MAHPANAIMLGGVKVSNIHLEGYTDLQFITTDTSFYQIVFKSDFEPFKYLDV